MGTPPTTCPYCCEEVLAEAQRCKHCGEYLARPTGRPAASPFPTFCLVIFVLDAALCALRLLVVIGTVAFLDRIPSDHALAGTVHAEILTGVAIVLLGGAANALCLTRQRSGVAFGWGNVLATLASTAVGIWQSSVQMGGGGAAQWVGVALAVTIRVARLATYVAALLQFARWRRPAAA